jgi:hypothetical protein
MAYAVSFVIPFRAEMSPRQVTLMTSELGMTFHAHSKLDLPFLAFARLDTDSGLLLIGDSGDRWRLECRIYGWPPARVVDARKARAAWVVGLIDPSVMPPPPASPLRSDTAVATM